MMTYAKIISFVLRDDKVMKEEASKRLADCFPLYK